MYTFHAKPRIRYEYNTTEVLQYNGYGIHAKEDEKKKKIYFIICTNYLSDTTGQQRLQRVTGEPYKANTHVNEYTHTHTRVST